jgi:hypothetical protein
MAGWESLNGYMMEYLNGRITSELVNVDAKVVAEHKFGVALCIVQSANVYHSLNEITSEEAKAIYDRIFGLFPQFEESLKAELEKKRLG